MKTLDEVIYCLEGCGKIDCDDCPYHYEDENIEVDDCAQSYKDALYYLKVYQNDLQKKCRNCKYWHGNEAIDWSDDDEYNCEECDIWTMADDFCSRWVERE